jgi:PAS domain S-box-containing protein
MASDFSTLFEFLPIGAYRSLPDGTQLRANPALVRQNGYASEAELLAAVHDIAQEWYVDPARRAAFCARLEAEGTVVGFESEVYRHRTRERIWISENAHVVRGPLGQVLFYEGTVEEITERVRAREALQLSEARLQQLVALIPGVVYRVAIDAEGRARYTFVSRGVRELYGIEPEEALADGTALTRRRHPDDEARIGALTQNAVERGLPLVAETRVVLDDGTLKWVQVLSTPAPSEHGERVRVGLLFDITAARQADALRHERDRAAAASLAQSQFLSRVSHELRTPLNAILGFAQLLDLDPGDGERQRAWTRQVLASGRHLLALVDDVLDLSSVQTGQLPVSSDTVLLAPVVQEMLAMLAPTAREAGVELQLDATVADAPPVRADRKRVMQIVSNLLSNAIKYNRRGGWVRVTAVVMRDELALSVADNGPGLDADQRTRLFQPFERLGARGGHIAGTGLGLALSRQLAEAMGGGLDVDSEAGRGAVFSLRLPQA